MKECYDMTMINIKYARYLSLWRGDHQDGFIGVGEDNGTQRLEIDEDHLMETVRRVECDNNGVSLVQSQKPSPGQDSIQRSSVNCKVSRVAD